MRTTQHKNLGSEYARSPAGHLFLQAWGGGRTPCVPRARPRARALFGVERLARLPPDPIGLGSLGLYPPNVEALSPGPLPLE